MKSHFDGGGLCAVCARPAAGIGYHPRLNDPMIYFCEDVQCFDARKVVYGLITSGEIKQITDMATSLAGNAGGQYLDQIGKTDVAVMEPGEWQEFIGKICATYHAELQRIITDKAGGANE